MYYFDEIFKEDKFAYFIKYISDNQIDYLDNNLKKKINLKKNTEVLLCLNRNKNRNINYDLLSDFIFEYERGIDTDLINIKNLPNEINEIIKSYLLPKFNVNISLCRESGDFLKKAEEIYNEKKYIVKKKINLNMINNGQKNFSYVCNHLPIGSIIFNNVCLRIISDQDCELTINIKGTMLNYYLRGELFKYDFHYLGKEKLVLIKGMIGIRNYKHYNQ